MAKCWPILIALLLIGTKARSQKIFFEQLTTAEGLPSDYVNCLFEDSQGNLWIGTDKGACRFDGLQFQYFSNDNGLPSNFVSCFAEDPVGNIWIATLNSGVSLYDGKKIKPFANPAFKTANITEIIFNADSSFFLIAERKGVCYFTGTDSQEQVFEGYSFVKKIGESFFLTGTTAQLVIYETIRKKLVLNSYPELPDKVNFSGWLSANSLVAVKNNSLLNYTFDQRKLIVKDEFIFYKPIHLPFWTDIKKVVISENELLVATTNGLFVRDKSSQNLFTSESGLGTNYVKSVFKDKHGTIYICTYGAGIRIWPAGYLSEYQINGKVTSLFSEGNETYVTTTKSVYQYNDRKKRLDEFSIGTKGNYTSIYKVKNGDFYLGTLNSYYKFPALYDLAGSNMIKYSYSANTGTSGFTALKNMFLIATYGDGIFLHDNRHKRVDTLDNKSTPPASTVIESLVPLGNSVAALTYNSGLTIYDSAFNYITLSKEDGLLSNTVYTVFKETENKIWIGTKNGLNLFNGTKIIKTYAADEGLTGTNVLCIFKDQLSRMWVLSDKFLHLMDDQTLRPIRSHPLLFDEKNSINRAAYCQDNDKLFIGLTDALLVVNMNKVIPDTIVHTPKLLGLAKDSLPLNTATGHSLTVSNPTARITFRFAGRHNSFTRQNDIYYKLNGFDDNWKRLANSNEAFYQKLSAGKYELFAKTINPDGYSSPDTSLISFEVLPSLWKRNWFITLASVILLAIFFSIGIMLSKRRYKQKLRHLEEEYRLQLERERIARELHDSVGSQLTYLINKIDDDYSKLAEKKEAEKLSTVARSAMQELRETIWALDKKEVHWDDLQNKIRQLTRLYKSDKQAVELDWQLIHNPTINSLEALNVFRIVQEALNNAGKYSHATLIKITVFNDNSAVCLEISDNGKGFDTGQAENGYGLKNLKKRAEEINAVLKIQSGPRQGTSVRLCIPGNQPFS